MAEAFFVVIGASSSSMRSYSKKDASSYKKNRFAEGKLPEVAIW